MSSRRLTAHSRLAPTTTEHGKTDPALGFPSSRKPGDDRSLLDLQPRHRPAVCRGNLSDHAQHDGRAGISQRLPPSPSRSGAGAFNPAAPVQSNTVKGYIDTTGGVPTLHVTSLDDGTTHSGFVSFTGTLGTNFTGSIVAAPAL